MNRYQALVVLILLIHLLACTVVTIATYVESASAVEKEWPKELKPNSEVDI